MQGIQGRTKNHTAMRLMLDTCVIIDLLTDVESLSKGVLDNSETLRTRSMPVPRACANWWYNSTTRNC
ncbi:MAG: hypothetical protein IJP46_00375 [Prevotella sp.]|nr:hypothetical protein [Prevotella sp.]